MTSKLRSAYGCSIAALLILASTGCALKLPVVELYPPIPDQGLLRGYTERPIALGMLPLADQRPTVEREGQRPRLWVFVLYNQRIGTYRTGNEHFARPASVTLSEALTDVLHETRFGGARLLEGTPTRLVSDALETCDETGLDYVGVGSIDSLYGAVDEKTYFGLVPVPFFLFTGWDHSVGDALGVITLDLEIVDCGTRKPAYQRRITRQLRYAGEGPTHAVRLALVDVLEQIRNETTDR